MFTTRSKSTDKLGTMKEIVKSTLEHLSQEKCDKLISVEINWDNLELGGGEGYMPVPKLKITFAE